jgi:hypothetical protein
VSGPLNYFEYFSEIEERFSARRGSVLLLSTLDWALIETWREAGVPLEAVLRGIDRAFDKYDERTARAKGRMRKVNGLAWCAQAVMEAAEELVEAATGAAPVREVREQESGFEGARVAAYLERNAEAVAASRANALSGAAEILAGTAARLRELAKAMRDDVGPALDELDRTLTVLEERMVAVVKQAVPESEAIALRESAERELAPYRSRMTGAQLKQVSAQFEQKRLLEAYALPRLSLFYMGHE